MAEGREEDATDEEVATVTLNVPLIKGRTGDIGQRMPRTIALAR